MLTFPTLLEIFNKYIRANIKDQVLWDKIQTWKMFLGVWSNLHTHFISFQTKTNLEILCFFCPPSNSTILDPCPTLLTCYSCAQKKRNRNLIVMNIQNDEWKNPAMFCHRVNNVNKKCEQLWTNDMKVVWNMLKNESHRIEIKHILQKKKGVSYLVF